MGSTRKNPEPLPFRSLPFTLEEAWKALAHPPANPSPELQAYLDEHEHREKEQARWEVELPPERLKRWGTLAKKHRWDDLHVDQVQLFEQWLKEHSDQAHELLLRLGKVGEPPASSPLPQKAYHSSGLFWLTANVLLKLYGLDDRLAAPLVRRLEKQFARSRSRYDHDAVTTGTGGGYISVVQRIAKQGAHAIRDLDAYLYRAVRNAILQANGYDRHTKDGDTDTVMCPWCAAVPITPPTTCPNCQTSVPEQPVDRQRPQASASRPPSVRHDESLDDPEDREHAIGPASYEPDSALKLRDLLHSLPDRLRPYAEFLVANPDATDIEAAGELECSTRTIERHRRQLQARLLS